MNFHLDWNQLVVNPLTDMAKDVVAFIPNLVSSLLTILAGILIAFIVRGVVHLFLKSVGFDALAEHLGWLHEGAKEGRPKKAPHQYGGLIAFWWVIFSAGVMAFDNLQLQAVSLQLGLVIDYAATVLTVVVLAVIGIFLGTLVERVVRAAATGAGYAKPEILAGTGKWSVIVLTILACLFRAGVPEEAFLAFLGITYLTLCITFVIAFGVGGAGFASELLGKLLKSSGKESNGS